MPADIRQLAQEAIGLAGKATPGPWVQSDPEFGDHDTSHFICSGDKEDPAAPLVATAEPRMDSVQAMGDAGLIAHAGTHYATIARELLEALDERDAACAAAHSWDDAHNDVCKTLEHITADRDALLADLPHVLGRCECVREVVARDGRGDPTFGYPEAHTVALAWLNGRIP